MELDVDRLLSYLDIPADGRTFGGKGEQKMAEALQSSSGRVRGERLEARVTAEQKRIIVRAAALQGRTVTDFVLTSFQNVARRVIEEHGILNLSLRNSQAFVEALLEPAPVNDRLRDTIRRYRQRTGV